MLSINASSTSSDSSNATDSLALSGAAAAGSSQAVAAAAASIEEVTFPHWVSFLLESARGQKIMEQWLSPYINTCVMCDLDYMIGKLEASDEDTECILEFSGLSDMFQAEWRAHKSREGGSDEKAVKLFKSLTKKQVLDLYHYYKFDFLAFDYYFEDYMKAAETEGLTTEIDEDITKEVDSEKESTTTSSIEKEDSEKESVTEKPGDENEETSSTTAEMTKLANEEEEEESKTTLDFSMDLDDDEDKDDDDDYVSAREILG